MEERQIEIISGAYAVFKRLGIRSVSMDDLARELRISKKTIYVYYNNKEGLVRDVLEFSFAQEDYLQLIEQEEGTAIDQLMFVAESVTNSFKEVNPVFLFDLGKYYPELSEEHFVKKTKLLYDRIFRNLELGIAQGLYRAELNASLVATLYTERIREFKTLCQSSTMKEFTFSEILCQMIEGHIRGVASEKGIELFETLKYKLEKIKNNDK